MRRTMDNGQTACHPCTPAGPKRPSLVHIAPQARPSVIARSARPGSSETPGHSKSLLYKMLQLAHRHQRGEICRTLARSGGGGLTEWPIRLPRFSWQLTASRCSRAENRVSECCNPTARGTKGRERTSVGTCGREKPGRGYAALVVSLHTLPAAGSTPRRAPGRAGWCPDTR